MTLYNNQKLVKNQALDSTESKLSAFILYKKKGIVEAFSTW